MRLAEWVGIDYFLKGERMLAVIPPGGFEALFPRNENRFMKLRGAKIHAVIVLMTVFLTSCDSSEVVTEEPAWDSQLNILWLVAEDLGP